MIDDPRLGPVPYRADETPRSRVATRALLLAAVVVSVWYFGWLLQPSRIGTPVLYGLLVAAELFNLVQACGFWWTASRDTARRPVQPLPIRRDVDVLIPVYGEPVDVVEPTVAAATRLRGARVHVALLDDGDDPAMRALAYRHSVRYIQRHEHAGAKAGNINHALRLTDSPYVMVLDCDHVPRPEFLERTLGEFGDPRMAFVQTPQYYANAAQGGIAAAAWAQQALFFGPIARGKDELGAMFCAGTNVVFRRRALEQVEGFPEDSVTEDFKLSIRLHERGWRTAYVPEVLALGLGPQDMASYVSQQLRWSRGCLSAIGTVLRARLPLRLRLQYLLSSMFFLTGWTVLIYMTLPVVRMLTGAQPLAAATADQFLLHFAPYFCLALGAVARAGRGRYTFAGFALAATTWWVHVLSSLRALTRRPSRFVVTPKRAGSSWQPRAVWPSLVAVCVLAGSAAYALLGSRSPSALNNATFAMLHVTILLSGAAAALRPQRRRREKVAVEPTTRSLAAHGVRAS
ncbi:MAG TPA: glycosyltransferase [Mycobacteriales bacterium]|nr:glycosyltransferase [Mycobacteriales bacterium]